MGNAHWSWQIPQKRNLVFGHFHSWLPLKKCFITQTSHPVSGVEVPINPLKSRKRFMSAGKPARKSVTSAQISSFRVINPSSSFWRKSCNFSKAAAKEISAISSAVRQNSGPDERRSLSSRTPTARNRYRVNTMAVWAHMAS